jgi:hypothetical protein
MLYKYIPGNYYGFEAISTAMLASRYMYPVIWYSHCSATNLHLSSSPPSTRIILSLYSSKSAKGVWLCMNIEVSSGIPSLSCNSSIRSASDLPPPFVRRMNGMWADWSSESASRARGIGSWLRRSTPSMLKRNQSFHAADAVWMYTILKGEREIWYGRWWGWCMTLNECPSIFRVSYRPKRRSCKRPSEPVLHSEPERPTCLGSRSHTLRSIGRPSS